MEAKKTPRADLENRRGLFLEIGLAVILAATLVAFNVKSYDTTEVEINTRTAVDEIEDVVIQTAEETPPPPPPEEPEMVVTDIKVVEDDAVIENEVGVIDMGDDANKAQEAYVAPEVTEEAEEEEETIFTVVEDDPEFPGGLEALYKYVGENIVYPQVAKDNNITGKVYVTFVVERDGSVSGVKVLRDIGGGCGPEAVRVVKSLPRWKPGKQRGRPVRTQYNLPISFNLRG